MHHLFVLALLGAPVHAADVAPPRVVVQAPRLDLDGALEALSSPEVALRAAAEWELGRLLDGASAASLAERIPGLGPEARLRLAAALGSRDRFMELAADLAIAPRDDVAVVGRWAIEASIERWAPGLQPIVVVGDPLSVRIDLAARDQRSKRWVVGPELPLERAVELLVAADTITLPLIVDPALMLAPPGGAGVRPSLEGTWPELLDDLTADPAVEIGGLLSLDDEGRERIVALLLSLDELVGIEPPDAQLTRWVTTVASASGSEPEARAAARALVATGWPAARTWLERLHARGSAAALDGLLAAARRGWHSPALATPETHSRLLTITRATVASGSPDAGLLLESLIGTGARLTDGRSALVTLLAEAGVGDSRWTHHALEVATRLGADDPELRRVVSTVLDDPTAPGATLLVALEAWSASVGTGEVPPTPVALPALYSEVRDADSARRALRALVRSGCVPPDGAPASTEPAVLALWTAWRLETLADVDPASEIGALVERMARGPRELQLAAAVLAGVGPAGQAALRAGTESIRAGGDLGPIATELAVRGGWTVPLWEGAVLRRAELARGPDGVDSDLLAALATGPVGSRAIELLLARLTRMSLDPGLHDPRVLDALEAVIVELQAQERDSEAQALFTSVVRATRDGRESPARAVVRSGAWPRTPGPTAEPLSGRAIPLRMGLPGARQAVDPDRR